MGAFSQDIIAKGSRLFSDRVTGVALGASTGQTTYDVECSGSDFLTVQGDMTGAAIGDLTVTVVPYEEDNVTPGGIGLAPVTAVANTISGGHVYAYGKYDITGVGRVRITWKNSNAGGQTLTRGSWRCSGY
jgi:hypothetical protein